MILIYTDELNSRIKYIARIIFTTILKNEISFTQSYSEFMKSELPKLNYSYKKFGDEFYIKPHRLMHLKALIQPSFQSVRYNGEKYFFESSADSDLPFDPFAASFYLVTRYEEYPDFKKGKYGRYPAEKSILYKYDLLKKPVVNIWANITGEKLKERFPEIVIPEPEFTFVPTIDIDNAWAVSNKGFIRTAGALMKSLSKGNFEETAHRLRVLTGKTNDPYDTYSYIDEVLKENIENAVFFFLLGDYKKYDKNVSWKNKSLQKLIRETASKYSTGIHPSYYSGKKRGKGMMETEKNRLEKITGNKIVKSRQHYIRLNFPKTYRNLVKAGIQQDYSMGYPEITGFRAGICTPYNFYDIKKEKETSLKIVPFQVMDVTLKQYMKLTPDEAVAEIKTLMQEVKKSGGTFSAIWHNETVNNLGEWEGYRDVFEKMIKLGTELSND